jgi:putative oxidoreductase
VKVAFEFDLKIAIRWMLGLLMIWASISKIANVQEFFNDLAGYKLPLPYFVLQLTATSLPWLELICGVMLLLNLRVQAALLWATILFAIFIVSTGQAWARGLQISCGCFDLSMIGITPESAFAQMMKSAWFACLRAIVLFIASLFLLRRSPVEIRTTAATVV